MDMIDIIPSGVLDTISQYQRQCLVYQIRGGFAATSAVFCLVKRTRGCGNIWYNGDGSNRDAGRWRLRKQRCGMMVAVADEEGSGDMGS